MKPYVLVIEDNEQNAYLARFLLEKRGCAVEVAESGPAGVQSAQQRMPSLILLDIQLPGMDGYEVARALRGNPLLAEVPIVAVTSYAMVGDRERALESGCDGYIEKPIDPATFIDRLGEFLPALATGSNS